MVRIEPRLEILPPAQRALWDRLGETPEGFVLYGGTALALQLGHRISEDFDFFAEQAFDPNRLANEVPYLRDQQLINTAENTLEMLVVQGEGQVKVSFFGGLHLNQVKPPVAMGANSISTASLSDVFGMKCATVCYRAERKDYIDIYALILQAGITLSHGLAAAKCIYGNQYNPIITLKSLSHFADVHGEVPVEVQNALTRAVSAVDLSALPQLTPAGPIGELKKHSPGSDSL